MTIDSTAPCLGTKPPPLFAAKAKVVQRERRPGLDVITTGTRQLRQFDLALRPLPGEDVGGMLGRLAAVLQEQKATPVFQFVFGSLHALRGGEASLRRMFGPVTWPVTWVEGAGCDGGLAGTQVIAVSRQGVKPVQWNDRVVGCIYEDGLARHCLLGGLGPESVALSRPEQAQQALAQMKDLLENNGFAFGDLARTWFYLENMLSWYGEFNKVRTAFYSQHRFRIGTNPASTGVGGSNPGRAALALAAWAMQPLQNSFQVREVPSPLQCPASTYGSSFSRAVEFTTPFGPRLLVSGTASIAPGGKTLWGSNLRRQVDLTMGVVEAILQSRGMEWSDASRVTVYVKRPEFAGAFADWSAACARVCLPFILMQSDICRDELLFEIELDAIKDEG